MVKQWLNKEEMVVNRSSKIKINALLVAQLGSIVTFVVLAIMFYGGQIEINNNVKEGMTKHDKNIEDLTKQVTSIAIQTGTYATQDYVTRSVAVEKKDRIKGDDRIEGMVVTNQVEIIDLIKNNINK